MHALLDAVGGALGDAQSLMRKPSSSAAVKSASVIVSIPSTETAPASILRAERERGEDRELVRGVKTADVECRIGLGIAEPLSLAEADLERKTARSPCARGCSCRCR